MKRLWASLLSLLLVCSMLTGAMAEGLDAGVEVIMPVSEEMIEESTMSDEALAPEVEAMVEPMPAETELSLGPDGAAPEEPSQPEAMPAEEPQAVEELPEETPAEEAQAAEEAPEEVPAEESQVSEEAPAEESQKEELTEAASEEAAPASVPEAETEQIAEPEPEAFEATAVLGDLSLTLRAAAGVFLPGSVLSAGQAGDEAFALSAEALLAQEAEILHTQLDVKVLDAAGNESLPDVSFGMPVATLAGLSLAQIAEENPGAELRVQAALKNLQTGEACALNTWTEGEAVRFELPDCGLVDVMIAIISPAEETLAEDEAVPVVEEETPVIEEEEAPVVEEEVPVVEEETPVVEEEAPVVEEEEAPAVEEEAPVVEEEAPVIEEEAPVVEEEAPVIEEEAPVIEEEAPVVEEEVPIVEEEAPVVEEEAPVVEEEEAPAVEEEEAPVVEEEAPIVEEEEAPAVEEEAPIVEEEEAPVVEEEEAPAVEEEAPVVEEEEAPAVEEEAPVVEEEEAPAVEEEAPVVEEEEAPAVEEEAPVVEEEEAPAVEDEAPIVEEEEAPVVEEEAHVVEEEEAPAVEEEEAPAVEEEAPIVEEEEAPVVEEEEAPVVEEEAPVVEEEAPAVEEQAPIVEEEAPVVEEEASVIEEEVPAIEEEEAPVIEEEVPAIEEEEAPVIVEEATVDKAEEAPVVEQEETLVIEEEAPVIEEEAPVASEEAPIVEEEASVVEEQAPVVEEDPVVNLTDDSLTEYALEEEVELIEEEIMFDAQSITREAVYADASDDPEIVASGTCGAEGDNLTWTLDDEGVLTISGTGEMAGDYSCGPWGNGIKQAIIEQGVTSIGDYAFQSCSGLTSVTIPTGVTSIGYYTFGFCSGLTSVTIPEGVTSIRECAFIGCSSLTSVTIPEGVTSIGEHAFCDCSGLMSVTIPEGMTSIGRGAFEDCSNLTSVTIPEGVTSIGGGTFEDCRSLTSITIPDSVTSIGDSAFLGCSGLTSVTIPDGVTSIGDSAFWGCSGLTSVTIPEGVTSIGERTFSGCSGLTSVTIPEGVSSIGYYAFSNCSSLTSVTIPDIVTSIGECAFYGCSGLTSVTIPEGVTSIGEYAFYCCSSLTSVTIPEGVTSIGENAIDSSTVIRTPCTDSDTPTAVMEYTSANGNSCILIHDYVEGVCARCGNPEPIDILESSHPYASDSNETFSYNHQDQADYLKVTFSEDTAFESGCDTLTITDAEGNAREYSGTELAGKEVVLSGDHFTLLLRSDGSVEEYGFRIIAVTAISEAEYQEYLEELNAHPWQTQTLDDGTLVITGYTGTMTEIVIPSEIDGVAVSSIGYQAFYNCSSLTSVNIPEGVTSIGDSAFQGCSGLMSVTIPEGVTSIGDSAFQGCSGLTSVTIPESVTSIGPSAFSGCSSLTDVTIPESVTSIGVYTFYGCSDLTSVTIPEGVTSIGKLAFYNCSSLTSVTIPEGVTSIGVKAFWGCSSLTSVTIPGSVTNIYGNSFSNCSALTEIIVVESNNNFCHVDGVLYSADQKTLISYPGGKEGEYTIITGVTSIGGHAFEGCSSLTSVMIPEGVTSIGEETFEGCSGLTSVTIPEGVTSIGNYAFYGCSSLTSVTIPEGVTSIGDQVFCNCRSLTSATIPDSVMSIDYGAFYNCSSLTSVTIPEGVTSIGGAAFYDCSNLMSVSIPDSVTSIGQNAIPSNTTIHTPCAASPTAVIQYARDNGINYVLEHDYVEGTCTRCHEPDPDYQSEQPEFIIEDNVLTGYNGAGGEVIIPDGTVTIAMHAFSSNLSITSVVIPDSVTVIGDYAFLSCENLASVTLPDHLESIGESAFEGCGSLTRLTLPGTLTQLGIYAFHNCTSLSELTLTEGMSCLSEAAFRNCEGLTSVTIPGSVTYIPPDSFGFCTNLSSVTLCEGVERIGEKAFEYIDALTSVSLPETLTTIDEVAFFADVWPGTRVPDGVSSIGDGAFGEAAVLYAHVESPAAMALGEVGYAFTDADNADIAGKYALRYLYEDSQCKGLELVQAGAQIKSVTIHGDVTRIGEYAFGNCDALRDVTIPGTVKTVAEHAFWECDELESVTLEAGVGYIGHAAFAGCNSLTRVTVPASVTRIDSDPFPGNEGFAIYTPCTSAARDYAVENFISYVGEHDYQDGVCARCGKAPFTVQATGYEGTYDGAAHGIAVTYNDTENVTVRYGETEGAYEAEESPTYTDAGTYTVCYRVAAEGYAPVTGSALVSISKKTASLAWANTSLTYSGKSQAPTATVSNLASGDECTVTVTGGQKNAGSYTATASTLSNGNYALPAAKTRAFTIGKKTVSLSWTNTSFTYDGQSHAPTATATGLVSGDACTVTVTGGQKNAGSYTATASKLSNGNYALPSAKTKAFTIKPKTVGLTWANLKFTYDKKNHVPTATATGIVSGDTCTVTVTGKQTNAGDYTATASGLSNNNYALPATKTKAFTIKPKTVGLTWKNVKFVYDKKSHVPTATATGVLTGDTCTVTVTGKQTNAGDYTATASKLSNANYALPAAKTQAFKIKPKTVGLTWKNVKFIYDKQSHAPKATATGILTGDTCTVTVAGAQVNAGTYTATASKLSNANYALPATKTKAYKIKPKTVVLTWKNLKFTYDGKSHAPTAVITGIISGDTCKVTVTGEQKNAGTYTATASKLSNANYALPVTKTKVFKIKAKTVELTWKNVKFTYDGKSHVPTATATGLIAGDKCTVTVTGEQTKVGTYTATASKLSNPNYALPATKTKAFKITK